MASASAPTFAPSGSVTTIASAASAPARISPKPQLSPKYHRPRGITTNDAVSRANASSSSLSFATAATQRRRNAIGAVTSAPQIPRRTPPRMPPNISTTQRHIPTALHTMREHSVPELIGERNEDDMDENDSLGCYDEVHHGLDKTVDADGTLMSSAKIRTIHKLAERRRRREMKNLFDTLRRCLPIDKTIRLSKWEVLKKAIEVISNQDAEIRMLRLHIDSAKSLPSSSPH
ncbi:hypothetical protein H4R24_000254 [Coemansia sp. RSA 988]|nr:hypothetical protein H4R24_000254 [Coemansia sp. RSA 988]